MTVSNKKDAIKTISFISFDKNSAPTRTKVTAKDLMELRLDPTKPIKIVGPFYGNATTKESN